MSKHEYGKIIADSTTFKIGGPVFCWVEAESHEDLLSAIMLAEEKDKEIFIIGKGSNVLFDDAGFQGVVIKLGKNFDYIKIDEHILSVGSATPISKLVKRSYDLGLKGAEFLALIPGSLGGGIFMNAGVRDAENRWLLREIKDIVEEVDVFNIACKKQKILKKGDIPFKYRSSGLEGNIVLGARLRLEKDEKSSVANKINSFMKSRIWMNSVGGSCAGSVFKNPPGRYSAGELIEKCGLKGRKIGGAAISYKHANFIVNSGRASSKDVFQLIELARTNVKEKFGIELELELKIVI